MNITIIIGWVISFGLVLFGIFNGGQIDWFIDPPSIAITVGGTIGCLIGSFPLSYLKNLPKYLKLALLPKKFNPQSYIEQIVEFAKIARTKGLISLEDSANKCTDPFLKESLMLIVDANDLGQEVLGYSSDITLSEEELHGLIADNPCGQGKQTTPIILIRKKPVDSEQKAEA